MEESKEENKLKREKKVVTIEEIYEEAIKAKEEKREPEPLTLNSPRSLKACKKVGIKPFQLKPISLSAMIHQSSTAEIARLRYEYQENKRFDMLKLVLELKSKLETCEINNSNTHEDAYQLNSTIPK